MSKKGIKMVAKIFSDMQETRGQLLQMATQIQPVDKQDILLAHLLEHMKDKGKNKFSIITLMGAKNG